MGWLLRPVIFLHFKPILAQRRNWEQIWASGLWPSCWAAQTVLKQLSQLPTMGGSGIVTQKQSITGSPVANICAALPPGLGHLLSDGATSQQEETAAWRGNASKASSCLLSLLAGSDCHVFVSKSVLQFLIFQSGGEHGGIYHPGGYRVLPRLLFFSVYI